MSKPTFKSANKPEGSINYINPKELADAGTTGVIVEGRFVGRTPKNQFDKEDWKFESLTDKGANGEPKLIIVNDAGNLKYRMSTVKPGTLVQVVYEGRVTIQEGKLKGKSVHQFDVLVAE